MNKVTPPPTTLLNPSSPHHGHNHINPIAPLTHHKASIHSFIKRSTLWLPQLQALPPDISSRQFDNISTQELDIIRFINREQK